MSCHNLESLIAVCCSPIVFGQAAQAQGAVSWSPGYAQVVNSSMGAFMMPAPGFIKFLGSQTPDAGNTFAFAEYRILYTAGGPVLPGGFLHHRNGSIGQLTGLADGQDGIVERAVPLYQGSYTVNMQVSYHIPLPGGRPGETVISSPVSSPVQVAIIQ